jgi:hypothetical protein
MRAVESTRFAMNLGPSLMALSGLLTIEPQITSVASAFHVEHLVGADIPRDHLISPYFSCGGTPLNSTRWAS